ncbi:hypothetical protein [Actinoplanes couchii]|uniref:Uncharacterized protein n=1 Tax=Actinoplanes couchii TaxID=403638 RepID=A0ABQ3XMV5_9ACTN|nr:hypothetical protein [Actinoplanes couchii]MDR6317850.1 hypothetical protein [Actinoplanes couchii]GID59837.1 hypothetical protein Aco03nite_082410 [Actinoplanes couchii]
MTSRLISTLTLVATIPMGSPAQAADPVTASIEQKIVTYLTGIVFTSQVTTQQETPLARSGSERQVSGTIGVPTLVGARFGDVYQGTIEFDFLATYSATSYSGESGNHTDQKSPHGRIRTGILVRVGKERSTTLTAFTFLSSDPSTDHDSTRLCADAIRDRLKRI